MMIPQEGVRMTKPKHSKAAYQKVLKQIIKDGKYDPSKDPSYQRFVQKMKDITQIKRPGAK